MRRTILAALSVVFVMGCGPSVWQQLVTTIETGLENGTTLAQLEAIVVQFFPQFANDAAIVDSILQAVISLLQTTNVLPPTAQANANALQSQIGVKLAAAKKTGWVLPPDAADVIAGIAQGHSPRLVAAIQGAVTR
jgi:hypothetical protein